MECELKVREQQEYRAHYCGLCKAIGRRYGLFARAALNYDCAFLSAFLSAAGPSACFERRLCLCHVCRKKQPMVCQSEAVDYAADVNVLLAWYSAWDHWTDEKRLPALALSGLLLLAKRKVERLRPALFADVAACMERLHQIERERSACTDEPSDAFGRLMRAVIHHAPALPDAAREPAGWMFYNLGRWIYLSDAWEDRERDGKRGAYNPFLLAGTEKEQAAFLLYVSLSEAEKGYDLIELAQEGRGLIDNIMHLGCRMRTRQFMNEEKAE